MKKDNFPTKEEFYKKLLKLRIVKERKKDGEYLGYLKEQKIRKKSRKVKYGVDELIRKYC